MALIDDIGGDLVAHYEVGAPLSGFVTLSGDQNNYVATLADRVSGGAASATQGNSSLRPRYRVTGTANGRPSIVLHEATRYLEATLSLPAGNRIAAFWYVKVPAFSVQPDASGAVTTLMRGSGQNVLGLLRPGDSSDKWRVLARFTGGLQDVVASTSPAFDGKWHRVAFLPLASGAVWKVDGVACDPDFTGTDTMQAVDTLRFGSFTNIACGEIAFFCLVDMASPAGDYEALVNAYLDDVYETAADIPSTLHGGWYPFKMGHVLHTSSNNRTHFGTTDETGKQKVFQYAHATGALTETLLYDATLQELHRLPTIMRRASDGRLLAFYSHGTGGFGDHFTRIAKQLSTNPDDSTAWGAAQLIDPGIGGPYYYYLQPFQLTGEANTPIYVFFKKYIAGDVMKLYYIKSTDDGATWGAPVLWFEFAGERPYFTAFQSSATRIDFALGRGHPNEVNAGVGGLWHAYYEGGSFFESDGSALSIPFGPAEATEIYDGAQGPTFFQDIVWDAGVPVIAYQYMPGRNELRYEYAKWNGSAWVRTALVTTSPLSNNFDGGWTHAGCCALDPANPDVVYLGRLITGQLELFKYVTADGGATFTATQLTADSAYSNHEPRVPRGGGGFEVMWWRGIHENYLDAVSSVRTYPFMIGDPAGMLAASIGEISLSAFGTGPATAQLNASIGSVAVVAEGVQAHGPVRAVTVELAHAFVSGKIEAR